MGYVLLALVESKNLVNLRIKGTEKDIPNCYYFDRTFQNRSDGLFQGVAWLKFPMPIENEHIELEAIDDRTGKASGIKIKDIKSIPLKTVPYPNRTDILDFVAFCQDIAKYGGSWEQGTYQSPKGLWKMYLVKEIRNLDSPLLEVVNTPASMNKETGEMYWVQSELQKISVCNRFVACMHELFHYLTGTDSEEECDIYACEMAYCYGFGKYEIEATLIRFFGDCQPSTDAGCEEKENRVELMDAWLRSVPDLN